MLGDVSRAWHNVAAVPANIFVGVAASADARALSNGAGNFLTGVKVRVRLSLVCDAWRCSVCLAQRCGCLPISLWVSRLLRMHTLANSTGDVRLALGMVLPKAC